MHDQKASIVARSSFDKFGRPNPDSILGQLPPTAREWAESLPWEQRRYVLSLCHLMCAAPAEVQAEFLDDYTADGLVYRMLQDKDTRHRVMKHLSVYAIQTDLTEETLRSYVRQFYIHSAQDLRRQPDLYLEAALRLAVSTEERNSVFNYILGFELLKMMFGMSWLQHERLYRLQRNQEEFLNLYIRPIQHAHKINRIIVPKDERKFFAKRNYFIQEPEISERKLLELVIATFTADVTTGFGFAVIRHANAFVFDHDYIFRPESYDHIFKPDSEGIF
ncbi:cobyrinic acid a,c-diamide synthase [Leptolyngbya sp. 'hensonii']|uniref:cobyrinic acid a,c-diamide synthase n=1 Tax=Leptolyngbya sp. 'hensonii' TaxID=1922337 RepID=UPI000ADA01E9|nr:cobyrinic acid a,c-diamide synthase [Leptolyngbya sp. 'hensonii']